MGLMSEVREMGEGFGREEEVGGSEEGELLGVEDEPGPLSW